MRSKSGVCSPLGFPLALRRGVISYNRTIYTHVRLSPGMFLIPFCVSPCCLCFSALLWVLWSRRVLVFCVAVGSGAPCGFRGFCAYGNLLLFSLRCASPGVSRTEMCAGIFALYCKNSRPLKLQFAVSGFLPGPLAVAALRPVRLWSPNRLGPVKPDCSPSGQTETPTPILLFSTLVRLPSE